MNKQLQLQKIAKEIENCKVCKLGKHGKASQVKGILMRMLSLSEKRLEKKKPRQDGHLLVDRDSYFEV